MSKITVPIIKNFLNTSTTIKYGSKSKKQELLNIIVANGLRKQFLLSIGEICPSEEQELIIEASVEKNIIVEASAGTGKTSTIKFIMERNNCKNFLVLMYNKALQEESSKRLGANGECRTLHGFFSKYYGKCSNDDEMKPLLKKEPRQIFNFNCIVIDEAQDLTPLYISAIIKIINEFGIKQVIILGDSLQCVYGFNGATNLFLQKPQDILNFEFERFNLTETYRCTQETSDLVNSCLGYQKLKTSKIREKPYYCCVDKYSADLHKFVLDIIRSKGYKDNEILVVSANNPDNEKNPMVKMSNYLSRNGHLTYRIKRDSETKDSSNKIIFSAYPSTKGKEWKCVIMFDMDISRFYGPEMRKEEDFRNLTNFHYVGMTRSSETLILIQDPNCPPLPYLRGKEEFFQFPFEQTISQYQETQYKEPKEIIKSVVNTVKFMSEDLIHDLKDYMSIEKINPSDDFCFQRVVNFGTYEEDLSAPISTFLTYLNYLEHLDPLEDDVYLSVCIQNKKNIVDLTDSETEAVSKVLKKWEDISRNISWDLDYLKTGMEFIVIWCLVNDKWISNWRQIKNYDWIEDIVDDLKRVYCNLSEICIGGEYEKSVCYKSEIYNTTLIGRIDYISPNGDIYELKICSSLSAEHRVQLLVYLYSIGAKQGYLFNCMNNEKELITVVKDSGVELILRKNEQCDITLEELNAKISEYLERRE